MKKKIVAVGTLLFITTLFSPNVMAYSGYGAGLGRTDTINVNDYSTSSWDRFEYNYQFESGAKTKESFGVPTQTDAIAKNPQLENVRRNKDASFFPPSYGIFSGEIPTDATSLFHNNETQARITNATNYSSSVDSYYNFRGNEATGLYYTGVLASTSTMEDTVYTSGESSVQIGYSPNNSYNLTEPSYYSDGSIGTIKIPILGTSIKVFEGETLENMKKGAAHFEFTSAWDGNICVAAHNRGTYGFFEGIKNLEYGDEIIYTTKYGTRAYKVVLKEKISDSDYSYLGWTGENMITLITCAENQSEIRWCIQAVEK